MSSKVSNTEWGLVIGAAGMVDALQFFLDTILLGFLNPLIDLLMGMSLLLYFKLRGVKMDWKKGGLLGLTWLLETLGVQTLDTLPLWTGDVIVTMAFDKGEDTVRSMMGAESTDDANK